MTEQESRSIRFGVIGAGNIGSLHIRNLADGTVEHACLAAICEKDPEKLKTYAERYPGVACFEDYHDMIASGNLDAVIVAIPHYFHHEAAIAAMEAGLAVITEKPAGVRPSDVKAMIATADRTGAPFGIMFNQRTNPLYAKARELVRSGALGAPKRLTWIITNWYRTQSYYDSGSWRASWKGEGGGVLTNQSPHNLDLAQWIFGMPVRLRAVCKEGLYHRITVEDFAMIYGEYENGATMQFITTTGEFPGSNRLEIIGEGGKLVIEDGKLKLWTLKTNEKEVRFTSPVGMPSIPCDYTEILPDRPETAHRGIVQNFVNHILFGEPLLADGREGLCQVMLTCGSYLSAWKDDWVTLPIDDEEFNKRLAARAKSEREEAKSAPQEESGESMLPRWSVSW